MLTGIRLKFTPDMNSTAFSAALCRHPDFPAPGMDEIIVTGERDKTALTLNYQLNGDLTLLRLPDARTPVDPERLWAHTCCEVFWARAHETGYREYNFSPSGQWAAYAFSAYRERLSKAILPAPEHLRWQRRKNRQLTLAARLPLTALPEQHAPLRLALTVVLERADGRLAYYALQHPPGPPDFHHPAGFALNL
jgi:hypothetical protein